MCCFFAIVCDNYNGKVHNLSFWRKYERYNESLVLPSRIILHHDSIDELRPELVQEVELGNQITHTEGFDPTIEETSVINTATNQLRKMGVGFIATAAFFAAGTGSSALAG